ncbi:hypothetical protein [Maribacter litoralis]|uniref:Uncharacterized protein n=1 Tax=Maribacter litoralis TaxID=2059726 RepID=A0A653TU08_9FLAO|nr:hypothetical protein [Maribacter litoralis]VXB83650.1 conserved hypothetical protein [Maribacter litoralis]
MNFNWILGDNDDKSFHKLCIDIEYELRPKIVKFLIANNECIEGCTDFSCFHFDVDFQSRSISVSQLTPAKYRNAIKARLEREITF